MMVAKDRPVVIVGGGISGLSLALLLAEAGVETVVIEKEDRLGGLARSFTYDDFTFDIGPHRFHTYLPEVEKFIRDVLDRHALEINRSSKLQFQGRFYPWPLHPSRSLFRFPPGVALGAIRDMLIGFPRHETESFRDQIIHMYGETLYRHFFEGYSTKFLGIPPEATHRDWAKTGVDRAIIDARMQIQSLWALAWTILTTWKKPEMAFLYPQGGCEQFVVNIRKRLESLGCLMLCGSEVDELGVAGDRVHSVVVGDRTIEPSEVVWTGTIQSLSERLGLDRPDLNYLALLCYNVMLEEGRPFDFQWCYHGSTDAIFSRVSAPASFDASNTPRGKRSLCVEVTCGVQNGVYDQPEAHLNRVIEDMQHEKLLMSGSEVIDVKIERVPWAYPIYDLGYRDKLGAFEEQAGMYENLMLAGRLGKFWYNNMDHCIEAAFPIRDQILARLKRSPQRSA